MTQEISGEAIRGTIERHETKHWIADREIWLTKDKATAVEENDSRKAFLYCIAGRRMPFDEAAALGCLEPAGLPRA